MKKSSAMRLGRRTPSPSSSTSPSSISSSGATLSQTRSLPASIHPRQQLGGGESDMAGNGGQLPAFQGRAFRRAVSDRAVAAMGGGGSERMDIDAGDGSATFSPRVQPEENGRRLRYDRLARMEDQQHHNHAYGVRRCASDMEATAFPSARSGRAIKAGGGGPASVEVPCEQAVDGNVLRQPVPVSVNVKVEPLDEQLLHNQTNAASPPVQKSSRQFKHKAAEVFTSLPSFPFGGRGTTTAASSGQSPTFRSRQPERDPGTHTADWLQVLMDVILWRDLSRSTLVFGAGAFAILSASFVRDFHLNLVTSLSYAALAYLSAVFIRINVLRRAPSSSNWKLNEAAALDLTRNALPAVNSVLLKLSQLFSGDPGTTLKVAAALWCIAHSGYWMSLWTMFRLAFFGAFLVPRCYTSYSAQIHEQGAHLVSHLTCAWDSCPHKKLVLGVAGVVIWKFITISSRLWIAFFTVVVAVRKYQACGPEAPPPRVVLKKEY